MPSPWPDTLSLVDSAQPASLWDLDPNVTFLNHGSFGACPVPILHMQSELRARMEEEPVRFFVHELGPLLDEARFTLAQLVGVDPECLAFVPNATAGVNTVLRSLALAPGDELLSTDHAYNACTNALRFVAERARAHLVVAEIPFPIEAPEQVVEAVLGAVTDRTRLALIDHVTSPTGLIFPVAQLVAELEARGVETLVDGAHAVGMLPLDVRRLGASYYAGNCHKWLCSPKGAGILVARADRMHKIRPLIISHGDTQPRPGRSRFRLEFDWTGTDDPTAYLCAARCVSFFEQVVPGGWPTIQRYNHDLAVAAQHHLGDVLAAPVPAPAQMLGSMASIPLPPAAATEGAVTDPLQDQLMEEYGIEVPVFYWPRPPERWLRVSAQIYNRREQYELLGGALQEMLAQR